MSQFSLLIFIDLEKALDYITVIHADTPITSPLSHPAPGKSEYVPIIS